MRSLLGQALDNTAKPSQLTIIESNEENSAAIKEGDVEHSDNDTYIVQSGDTLSSVSLKNNISMATLKKYNRLYGRNSLYTGQVLQLKNPALQPSTWTNVSENIPDLLLAASSRERGGEEHGMSFTKLKDISNSHVSFIEKERLKSKSVSTRSLLGGEDVLGALPVPAAKGRGALSSSFKYKHNSNPDLKSLDQSLPSEPLEVKKMRRKSTFGNMQMCDWAATSRETQPTTTTSSSSSSDAFSLSSVPKALLFGSLQMLDSYFPNTFTPPAPPQPGLDLKGEVEAEEQRAAATARKLRSFHTQLHGNSSILLHSHIQCLVEHFPASLQYEAWDLLFATELHGSDLASFYSRSAASQFSLLVVRTLDNQVFGGFATEPWKVTKHGGQAFYGSGQCFLFRCHPSSQQDVPDEDDCPESDNVDVFEWQLDNYFFQWSNSKQVAMGGGGGHFGFVLDDDFAFAETNPCETFGNPHLTSHQEPFAVAEVELWGFGAASALKKTDESSRNREQIYMMSYES